MEAMIGLKTVGQIAREYQIHPVQITQWKGVIPDLLTYAWSRMSAFSPQEVVRIA
jgi:hypothetical protein